MKLKMIFVFVFTILILLLLTLHANKESFMSCTSNLDNVSAQSLASYYDMCNGASNGGTRSSTLVENSNSTTCFSSNRSCPQYCDLPMVSLKTVDPSSKASKQVSESCISNSVTENPPETISVKCSSHDQENYPFIESGPSSSDTFPQVFPDYYTFDSAQYSMTILS